jgi:hypothetical protein
MNPLCRAPHSVRLWSWASVLTLVMFGIVRVDGARPYAFPDIVAVRCAGQALNAGLNPYTSVRTVCGPGTLDFFYPPLVARLAAATVAWCGVPLWMAIFELAYAASFAALIVITGRLLARVYRAPIALLMTAGLILAMGGGVVLTGFQSGNIAVLFWAALAIALFALRGAGVAAAVILIGACIKVYLLYLLVVPALMRKDVRLASLVAGAVLLSYVAQWHFEPALFASYSHEVKELSQTPGYAGASSMQLGVWVAALTGHPAMRLITAALVAALLVWRGRHLVRLLLRESHDESARLRSLALLILALAVLSPRVTHYDLLILLPTVAILMTLPGQRVALVSGCIAIPWLFRCVLLAARLDPLKTLLQARYGLDYSTLWGFYLFATWAALTGYAWWALGRSKAICRAHSTIAPPT